MLTRELQTAQWFYLGWMVLAILWASASLPRPEWSEAANQLMLLGFLLVAHLPTLVYSLSLYFTLGNLPTSRRRSHRMTWYPAAYYLVSYLPLALVLAASYERSWDFARLGFSLQPERWIWSLAAGVLGCTGYYLWQIYGWRDKTTPNIAEPFEANSLRMCLPRGGVARILRACDTVILGPIAEEIVYRGFFVYLLGQLSGNPLLGICTGFLLFLILHLYQGPAHFPQHFAWYVLTIGLLYSPFGLLAVIAMHCLHNAGSVYLMQRRGREFIASRKRSGLAAEAGSS